MKKIKFGLTTRLRWHWPLVRTHGPRFLPRALGLSCENADSKCSDLHYVKLGQFKRIKKTYIYKVGLITGRSCAVSVSEAVMSRNICRHNRTSSKRLSMMDDQRSLNQLQDMHVFITSSTTIYICVLSKPGNY